MTDAEDVDLLQDDIADLALLQAEPVVDAEAEATEPKTEEPQAEEAQTEDDVLEKKKARSQGSASTANKAKRVPIPVPPHAKAAEEAPAPKPAPVKPATKPAPPSRPESVAVARGSSKTGRYFVMKSVSAPNVDYSIANGVWATQKHNEDKLQQAFRSGAPVYLLFSIVGSGRFQGYARMTSSVSKTQGNEPWQGSVAVGGTFQIRWERVADLSYGVLGNMTNPWNEDKPIRMCRDGQELPADLGEKLVKLLNERPERAGGRAPSRGGPAGPPQHVRGPPVLGRAQPLLRPLVPHRGMIPPPRPPPLIGMRPPMMPLNNPMMGPQFGMMGGPPIQPPFLGDPFMASGMLGDGFGNVGGGPGSGMSAPTSGMGRLPGAGGFGFDMGFAGPGGPGPLGLGGDRGGFLDSASANMSYDPQGRMAGHHAEPVPQRSRLPSPGPPRGSGRAMMLDSSPKMLNGHESLDGVVRGGFGPSSGGLSDVSAMRDSYMRTSPDLGRSAYLDLDDDVRAGELRGRDRGYDSRSRRDERGDRHRRTRSPSFSPPRPSRRRRSRSRSRSRDRKDFTSLSYDEYVEMYKKVQENTRRSNNSMMAAQSMGGMNSMMSMMGNHNMGQGMMGGGSAGMGGGMDGYGGMGSMGDRGGAGVNPQNLTEERYLDIWREYSRANNRPFDPDLVRGWYRQYMGSGR